MGRTRRDCPVCMKKGLLRLPNHLKDVHGITAQDVVTSEHSDDGSDISDRDDDDASNNSDIDVDVCDEGASCAEDDPWEGWVDSTFEQFHQRMKKRVGELTSTSGLDLAEAQKKTAEELLPQMNKELRKKFLEFLKLGYRLKRDSTYQKIMNTAKRIRLDDEMDWEESVTYAAKTRKLLLDRVLQRWISNWGDEADDSDDEDDDDDEDEDDEDDEDGEDGDEDDEEVDPEG